MLLTLPSAPTLPSTVEIPVERARKTLVTSPPEPAVEPLAPAPDVVDEWGRQSFPASDPPSNW